MIQKIIFKQGRPKNPGLYLVYGNNKENPCFKYVTECINKDTNIRELRFDGSILTLWQEEWWHTEIPKKLF